MPLTEALEAVYADPKEAMAAAKAMARKIRKGDTKAFAEVADRIEGKVTTHQDRAEQAVSVIVLDVPRPAGRPPTPTAIQVEPTNGIMTNDAVPKQALRPELAPEVKPTNNGT
jgi:hypothetical protein